jgi:hypothetical protein
MGWWAPWYFAYILLYGSYAPASKTVLVGHAYTLIFQSVTLTIKALNFLCTYCMFYIWFKDGFMEPK